MLTFTNLNNETWINFTNRNPPTPSNFFSIFPISNCLQTLKTSKSKTCGWWGCSWCSSPCWKFRCQRELAWEPWRCGPCKYRRSSCALLLVSSGSRASFRPLASFQPELSLRQRPFFSSAGFFPAFAAIVVD